MKLQRKIVNKQKSLIGLINNKIRVSLASSDFLFFFCYINIKTGNSKELHPWINYRIGVPPVPLCGMYNYLNERKKMKATSKIINATFSEMDWDSMRDYNEDKGTYRCRVTFSECSETNTGETNPALTFMLGITSGNLYSIVVNLDSKEFGETEEEKTERFVKAMTDKDGKRIPIPLTVVTVTLDKTYYTAEGLPIDVRKIAYVGTDDKEDTAIASVRRRLAKQLEDEELYESDPTKKQAEEKKARR